ARIAIIQDLGLGIHPAGQHNVRLADFERVQELAEKRTDGNTTLTAVGVLGGSGLRTTVRSLSAVRDAHFDRIAALASAHGRILRRLVSVRGPRFAIQIKSASWWAVFLHPSRLALFATFIAAGGDHTVSGRADRVVGVPVSLAFFEAVE